MLAAMTHPSRVLNLDMKAKLCMPKSYIYIFFFFCKKVDGSSTHLKPDTFPILFLPDAELPSLEEINSITKGLPKKIEAAREK